MSVIAGISTPNAPGGIAVIRISGDSALEIADKDKIKAFHRLLVPVLCKNTAADNACRKEGGQKNHQSVFLEAI